MKKFLLLASLVCSLTAMAQVKNGYPGQKTRMLFLLDGSGSMLTEMGNSNRWAVAVTLMNKMVDTLRTVENLEVGLRVFGHTQPNKKRIATTQNWRCHLRPSITSSLPPV